MAVDALAVLGEQLTQLETALPQMQGEREKAAQQVAAMDRAIDEQIGAIKSLHLLRERLSQAAMTSDVATALVGTRAKSARRRSGSASAILNARASAMTVGGSTGQ